MYNFETQLPNYPNIKQQYKGFTTTTTTTTKITTIYQNRNFRPNFESIQEWPNYSNYNGINANHSSNHYFQSEQVDFDQAQSEGTVELNIYNKPKQANHIEIIIMILSKILIF